MHSTKGRKRYLLPNFKQSNKMKFYPYLNHITLPPQASLFPPFFPLSNSLTQSPPTHRHNYSARTLPSTPSTSPFGQSKPSSRLSLQTFSPLHHCRVRHRPPSHRPFHLPCPSFGFTPPPPLDLQVSRRHFL